MFFWLSKLFFFFVSPVGFLFSLYLIYRISHKKVFKWILFASIYLLSNTFVINKLTLAWEAPPTLRQSLQSYDVGIVLTGGIANEYKLPTENIFLGKQADRITQTLLLYKEHKIKKIIISGGQATLFKKTPVKEATLSANFLIQCGVPVSDILIESQARNTHENALFSAKIIKEHLPTAQRILLITSAIHQPRAVACFAKHGLRVTPYGTSYTTYPARWQLNMLLPSANAFFDAEQLWHEWMGYLVYSLIGYL